MARKNHTVNYLFQIPQNEESNKGHFEDHLFKKGKNVFDLKNIREWGRNIYIYIYLFIEVIFRKTEVNFDF